MSSSSYDSSSDEEFDMNEDKDIALIVALHKNERPKHGGSAIGCERLRRARIEGNNRMMLNYFVGESVYPKRYFQRRFRMGTEFFQHTTECVKLHDRFLSRRGIAPEILDIAPSRR
jgi:hypothetical protein